MFRVRLFICATLLIASLIQAEDVQDVQEAKENDLNQEIAPDLGKKIVSIVFTRIINYIRSCIFLCIFWNIFVIEFVSHHHSSFVEYERL